LTAEQHDLSREPKPTRTLEPSTVPKITDTPTDQPVGPAVYGIPNCDSVKRARAALQASGLAHSFHNFKTHGVPLPQLDRWLATAGLPLLLNRQGTTWRQLGVPEQAATTTLAGARALMLAQPSVIKRPVVEWPDGALTVGLDAFQAQLGGASGP
jgi:arsenate reductase (glutaredoxin)